MNHDAYAPMGRKLLDAAMPLVQRAGSHAASFQKLADRVGVSKTTVHYYYPTKSSLLAAVIDRRQDELIDALNYDEFESWHGANKLRMYVSYLMIDDGHQMCPCGMLAAEIATLKPEVVKPLANFFQYHAKRLTAILEAGREDGSLRFSCDAEPLAWLILSVVQGAVLVGRVHGGERMMYDMCATVDRLVDTPPRELRELYKAGRFRAGQLEREADNEGGAVVVRHASAESADSDSNEGASAGLPGREVVEVGTAGLARREFVMEGVTAGSFEASPVAAVGLEDSEEAQSGQPRDGGLDD